MEEKRNPWNNADPWRNLVCVWTYPLPGLTMLRITEGEQGGTLWPSNPMTKQHLRNHRKVIFIKHKQEAGSPGNLTKRSKEWKEGKEGRREDTNVHWESILWHLVWWELADRTVCSNTSVCEWNGLPRFTSNFSLYYFPWGSLFSDCHLSYFLSHWL